jgi:hypothetical protein
MQDEEAEIRKTLNIHILMRIAASLGVFPSNEPPLLGEHFARSSRELFEAISIFRSKAVKHLSGIPLDQLRGDFTERGEPKTEEWKTWCLLQRNDFRTRFRSLNIWQLALLEPDRTFAKYDYWAKAAFFSLDEILWLSVGLQPLPEFLQALDRPSRSTLKDDPVVAYMVAQQELFRRSLGPNGYERRHTAEAVLSWVNRVDHVLHPGCRRMLELMVSRKPDGSKIAAEATGAEPLPEPKSIDPREKSSMAKLLVAMAMDQYGYVPGSKRSPIPKEIEGIAARLGMELTHDTIRHYLRLGAEHLPKDWKAHD